MARVGPTKLGVKFCMRYSNRRVGGCLLAATGAVAVKYCIGTKKVTCTAQIAESDTLREQKVASNDNEAAASPDEMLDLTPRSWVEALSAWAAGLVKYLRAWYRMAYCTSVVSSVAWLAPGILFFQDKEALYRYIIRCIEHLGPTFIKLAQWASSRPDLFDEELIVHMVKLQDDTVTYPFSTICSTLRRELGDDWEDTLCLEEDPIGSGCIAQVRVLYCK